METEDRKLYEAMFLVDSAEASSDWDGVSAVIKSVLERAEADVVSIKKWDERKLAYGINGKTRGTYILCYFRADGGRIRDIERDVQLSERIMRVLILSVAQQTKEDIEKDIPAMRVGKEKQKAARSSAKKSEVNGAAAQEAEKAGGLERSAEAAVTEEAEGPEQAETDDFEQTGPGQEEPKEN